MWSFCSNVHAFESAGLPHICLNYTVQFACAPCAVLLPFTCKFTWDLILSVLQFYRSVWWLIHAPPLNHMWGQNTCGPQVNLSAFSSKFTAPFSHWGSWSNSRSHPKKFPTLLKVGRLRTKEELGFFKQKNFRLNIILKTQFWE